MFKVRFHLVAGENFLKWQIKDTFNVSYQVPEQCSLQLFGCRLHNNRSIAEKIHGGENKSVCAWIECERVIVTPPILLNNSSAISFNPRKQPFWVDHENQNVDGESYDRIVTDGRKLFVVKAL